MHVPVLRLEQKALITCRDRFDVGDEILNHSLRRRILLGCKLRLAGGRRRITQAHERVNYVLRRGEALLSILGAHERQRGRQLWRHLVVERAHVRNRGRIKKLLQDLRRRVARVRTPSAEEFKEDDAQAVDVGTRVNGA